MALDVYDGRILLPFKTGYAESVPADHLALFADDTGALSTRDEGGTNTPIGGSSGLEVTLFDGAPNASNAYDIDLSSGAALDCVHLRGRAMIRSSLAATTDGLYVLFNADTTVTNYRHAGVAWTEAAGNSPFGGNTPRIGNITGASSPSDEYAQIDFEIDFFRSTAFVKKMAYTISLYYTTGASYLYYVGGVHWNSTAAITALKLRTDNHPTDTLNAASRLQLIGVKAA